MKTLQIRLNLKIGSFLALTCATLFSVGCNSNMAGNQGSSPIQAPILQGTSSGNPGGNPSSGIVTFKVISDTVLQNNCVSCHNRDYAASGVRYDSYEATIQNGDLSRLHASYLIYKEPSSDCKKISTQSMDLVRQWIEEGAVQ